jgi:hypothetical protein
VTGEKIEIVKDASSEGEAIIRLVDVFELPENAVFRIEPLDDDAGIEEPLGWPSVDHTALRMRVGEKGVELIVKAADIDAPALLPGTRVAVSVPSASIREELRWPGIQASARNARRGIVFVSAEKRRAEIAARAKARRAELESMAAQRLAVQAEAEEEDALKEASVTASAVASGDGLARLDVKRKGNMKLVASRDAAKDPPPLPPAAATKESGNDKPQQPPPPMTTQIAATSAAKLAQPPEAGAPNGPVPPVAPPSTPPGSGLHRRPHDPPLPTFYSTQGAASKQPAPPRRPQPASTPPTLPVSTALATTQANAVAEDGAGLPANTPKFLTRAQAEARTPFAFQRAFGLGFLVAALLAVASMYALRGDVSGILSGAQQAQPAQSRASETPSTLTTLSGILAAPEVSTRGELATSVDLSEALKRADQNLAGSNSGDKEEAKYWLRRALSLGFGDQRLVWALTQLGTIYAAPASGAPDYAASLILWELAAAQGDPVALCFLASLYEHGLGTAKNEVRALVLYRNAKAQGGCPNVDQSIARMAKGTP